jgi:hypothetical protein
MMSHMGLLAPACGHLLPLPLTLSLSLCLSVCLSPYL